MADLTIMLLGVMLFNAISTYIIVRGEDFSIKEGIAMWLLAMFSIAVVVYGGKM